MTYRILTLNRKGTSLLHERWFKKTAEREDYEERLIVTFSPIRSYQQQLRAQHMRKR